MAGESNSSANRPAVPDGLSKPWSRSDRPSARLIARPFQAFGDTEAASGWLLLVAAIVALIWANSPWAGSYHDLWSMEISLGIAGWEIAESLHTWINDGLMTIFFFVVGLEIKRELVSGELQEPRSAALPVFAAVGGMMVPAMIYAAFNAGGPGASGWGIPVATDIAFSLAVLTTVGKGLPAGLKLFLLAVAIVDDIGGILLIAIFYSTDLSGLALLAAAAMIALLLLARRMYIRAMAVYVVLGAGVWLAVKYSGIHPTVAGVALGLLTPTNPFHPTKAVGQVAEDLADEVVDEPKVPDQYAPKWLRLVGLSREAVSPLARLEAALLPWSSYVIIPLFALANAGVAINAQAIGEAVENPITVGIVLGLVAGKTIGVTAGAFAGVKMGLAKLPANVGWDQIVAVAAVAGIGFTVSLFVAGLAFSAQASLDAAKVGILAGSLFSGLLAATLLTWRKRALATGRQKTPRGAGALESER